EAIEPFAGYAFNKSHSAAYAYLAYVTAYLKVHYSVEFLAALLTSEALLGNTEKVVRYINECRELGVSVLPPDINLSGLNFSPDGRDKIRFGLRAVKNAGENSILAVIEARRDGPFRSLYEFCERVDQRQLNKRLVESLIKAGAMDSLNPAGGKAGR